jgi:hypothetical protein
MANKTYTHTFENGASIVFEMTPFTSFRTQVVLTKFKDAFPPELSEYSATVSLLFSHLVSVQFSGELPDWAHEFKRVMDDGLLGLVKGSKYRQAYEMMADMDIVAALDVLIDAYTNTRRNVPKASEELTVGAASRAEEDADFLPDGEA